MMKPEQNDENVKVFISECRKYYFYTARIQSLQDELNTLINRMEGTHSPAMDKVRTVQTTDASVRILNAIERKTDLETRISAYTEMMNWIRDCINGIPYMAYRVVIWRTCIEGEKLSAIADEYSINLRQLSRKRKKVLELALSEQLMRKHAELEQNILDSETKVLQKIRVKN